jgi:peroxiredoxin
MTPIQKGAQAPDFALQGHDDKEHKLSDYRGKNVVLAFYPLDFSPVCSKEHACFMDDLSQFNSLNAQVFGISVDSRWAHKAFAAKMGIQYPLLADFHPKGAVAEKYGLYQAEKGLTNRATVIIDKNGVVQAVQVSEMPQQRNNADILGVLKSLG